MVLRVEPMYGEKEKDISYDKMKFMFVHRPFESHCAMVNGVNSEGRCWVCDVHQRAKKDTKEVNRKKDMNLIFVSSYALSVHIIHGCNIHTNTHVI